MRSFLLSVVLAVVLASGAFAQHAAPSVLGFRVGMSRAEAKAVVDTSTHTFFTLDDPAKVYQINCKLRGRVEPEFTGGNRIAVFTYALEYPADRTRGKRE